MQAARDAGREVVERDIDIAELVEGAHSGEVAEVFACGTAAVVTPVARLISETFDVSLGDGDTGAVTAQVRDSLMGIQYGTAPDTHEWMHRVL